jgi:hypothetical protein
VIFGRGWKRRAALLALFVAAAALLWWFLHPRPSEEELLLALVSKAEAAVETKEKDEIMACIAKDYSDDAGLTRTDIFRLALYWERSTEEVDVSIDEYELDITPPTATGRFEVTLEFDYGGAYEPPTRLPLVVEFEKQRHGWREEWLVTAVSGHDLENTFDGL